MNKRTVLIFLSFLCVLSSFVYLPMQAQPGLGGSNLFSNSGLIDSGPNSNFNSNPYNAMNQMMAPKIPLGKARPEEKQDTDWQPAYLQPFPIPYLNLPQLHSSEREILSQSYFVAINGPAIKTFSELYKENNLENISSFITADSVIHPLLSFQNTVRLTVIDKSVRPLLKSLLVAMSESAGNDYKEADDAEIKEEAKYNLAFLYVAIKILQPDYMIGNYPGVKQIVESELASIKQKRSAYSLVFHRQIPFNLLKPIGWRQSTESARQFFTCWQWLSTVYLNLNDSQGNNGNEFRRSFLLFRSLMTAILKDKIASLEDKDDKENHDNTGYTSWQKITEILRLLNLVQSKEEYNNFLYVLPNNFAAIFPTAKSASRITSASLSDPLTRTKLFLTLKSNAPRKQLDATSIFSLNKNKPNQERQLQFCLMPPMEQPSAEECFQSPVFQKDAAAGFSLTPVGLILAQNRGTVWAKRILDDNASKLNSDVMAKATSEKVVASPFWNVLKTLSSGYMEPAPLVFQTKQWRTFCVERQIAAWVDKMLVSGIGGAEGNESQNESKDSNKAKAATATGAMNNVIRKFGIPSWLTTNKFNYLEPAATVYGKMAESEAAFENALSQSNLFPAQYVERSRDFTRLLKRLSAIANVELNNQTVNAEDQLLLAGIDKVLNVIEPPLVGNMYISFAGDNNDSDLTKNVILYDKTNSAKEDKQTQAKEDSSVIRLSDNIEQPKPTNTSAQDGKDNEGVKLGGVNMGLGYPTCVYVIIQFKRAYYLLRGAAYSYHEKFGSAINSNSWQHQLEMGFYMEPPFWCESFQRRDQ